MTTGLGASCERVWDMAVCIASVVAAERLLLLKGGHLSRIYDRPASLPDNWTPLLCAYYRRGPMCPLGNQLPSRKPAGFLQLLNPSPPALYFLMYSQSYRKTDIHTDRSYRHTDRCTDRHTYRLSDCQTYRQKYPNISCPFQIRHLERRPNHVSALCSRLIT